jgi:hypothetical protein
MRVASAAALRKGVVPRFACVSRMHVHAPINVLVACVYRHPSAQRKPIRVSVLDRAGKKAPSLMRERIKQLTGLWAVVCAQPDD